MDCGMEKTCGGTLVSLFLTFLKIGACTFGGGYGMLRLLEDTCIEKRHWLDNDEFRGMVAMAESTPGPIAVNSATFVGYRVAGFFGALAATCGVVLPSFAAISLISLVLSEFEHLKPVKYAFFGIRAGVLALLVKALVSMIKKTEKKPVALIISLGAFLFAGILGANVILVLACAAALGLANSVYEARRKAK